MRNWKTVQIPRDLYDELEARQKEYYASSVAELVRRSIYLLLTLPKDEKSQWIEQQIEIVEKEIQRLKESIKEREK